MRFASYVGVNGSPTWGIEQSGVLYDLGLSGAGIAPDLGTAIATGSVPTATPDLEGLPTTAVDQAQFLPLISAPAKILCIGVNYHAHQEETGRPNAVAPVVFTRFADTLAAAGAELPIPPETQKYDYEGELALVIGAPADHVSAEGSWEVIAGYGLFNDLSARDWQRHTGQWVPGKNFRNSGPFGPYFVPAADLDDLDSRAIVTRVNGDVRQSATLGDLIFSIPQIIEYVTAFTPLQPGDVIVTGTPGGVGLFREPPEFLTAGDVVEVEIDGLGVLSNRLV